MTPREHAIAAGIIRPAVAGDPTPGEWVDEPTLRLDRQGRLEAERERAKPAGRGWRPGPEGYR
jgi:hypothetical protein